MKVESEYLEVQAIPSGEVMIWPAFPTAAYRVPVQVTE
jgi:hypothetical protein